jgi:chromate transporter
MIYLELFLTFFKIGLFTFGGGYAMIPLVTEAAQGFGFSDSEIMNFIAVSESTPGPIAINMATFIGSTQGGFLGALCATLGVVLPSFIIILIIAMAFKKFAQYKGVKTVLTTVRPIVVGMILSAGLMLGMTAIGFASIYTISIEVKSIILTALIGAIVIAYKLITKKSLAVIPIILISAVLGIIVYII